MIKNIEPGMNLHIFVVDQKYTFKAEAITSIELVPSLNTLEIKEKAGDIWVFNLDQVSLIKGW